MKATLQLAGWSAVLVAACLGVPGVTFAACGTIQFTGMVVAPPFEVTPGAGSAQTPTLAQVSAAHAVTVTYAVEPNAAPVADVSLVAVRGANSENVDASFIDSKGRPLQSDRDGAYHLSGSGGVLSLAPRSDGVSSGPALVTVVTSYQ